MTITLRPEHEQLIAEAMESGSYKTPEDVVGHALEMLHSEEEWLHSLRDPMEAKIERALGQFERGEFFSPEESRSDMEARKANWLARQHSS
jgi:Arc/MetJ-type ribon-helix-helix transcriptional regulator